jgi:hypothetical protein
LARRWYRRIRAAAVIIQKRWRGYLIKYRQGQILEAPEAEEEDPALMRSGDGEEAPGDESYDDDEAVLGDEEEQGKGIGGQGHAGGPSEAREDGA